jgi:SAM-dependent methyltransferase
MSFLRTKRSELQPELRRFDQLLLCAFHLWRQREAGRRYHVVIVTDDPERHPECVCRHMLGQWKDWVTIDTYWKVWPTIGDVQPIATSICLAAVENPGTMASVRERCQELGMPLIEPRLPEKNSSDEDFYREVTFFDYEFGGKNEWDGKPSTHPFDILRELSAVRCQGIYPAWGVVGMARPNGALRVLDVGCGPVSALRWGALTGEMVLTGLDPLIEMYALVRARHGFDALPQIRCAVEIPAFAEQLDELVPDGSFDVIFSRNALDHTREPQRVISHFARKLVPGGRVLLEVATREGTRQKWDQFHKTDIDLADGQLVYRHQHTSFEPLLRPEDKLRLRTIASHTTEWLSVALERTD